MSGPKPPGRESEEPDSARGLGAAPEPGEPRDDAGPAGEHEDFGSDHDLEALDDAEVAADHTGLTDAYSRAYSAPEAEHFITGPYLPADMSLYDYDSYDESSDHEDEDGAPRWPWIVGGRHRAGGLGLTAGRRHGHQQAGQPRHHHAVPAADAGRDHHDQATATATTATTPAQHRDPNSYGDPNSDGDPYGSTPAAARPGAVGRAATGDLIVGRGGPASAFDAGRASAGHLFGDRHQSSWRHHLGDLCRRLWAVTHPAQRLHSVVDDRDTDLDVRRRLGAGVQPVPGEQAQLLDHHQRRNGALVE
jgi:hypothetical protein